MRQPDRQGCMGGVNGYSRTATYWPYKRVSRALTRLGLPSGAVTAEDAAHAAGGLRRFRWIVQTKNPGDRRDGGACEKLPRGL